ncbi:hypothetical protein CC80DRAFT_531031 [Byssothecium circinans]|uniref:Uncharacterized protein n=1 Tax=Byssothecium circinans TaxID=147558 RepID=A0A6A5UDD3_9PLEO|nr:hypothetical protein CC80DRAFT_531031 [Byssothecium circinans]
MRTCALLYGAIIVGHSLGNHHHGSQQISEASSKRSISNVSLSSLSSLPPSPAIKTSIRSVTSSFKTPTRPEWHNTTLLSLPTNPITTRSRSYRTSPTKPKSLTPIRPTRNATMARPCTGCNLGAFTTMTWFTGKVQASWTSVVVTETVLAKTISYFDGNPETLQGTTVTYQTLEQTKTLIGPANQTITHTTPVFKVIPTKGVTLERPIGPTYVMYQSIYGGDERPFGDSILCTAEVDTLKFAAPKSPEDYDLFIETITNVATTSKTTRFALLPTPLIGHLKQNPEVQQRFQGHDIATCTLPPRSPPPIEGVKPSESVRPPASSIRHTSTASSSASTFLSTTYASTSTHITVRGCLRCDNTEIYAPKMTDVTPTPSLVPTPSGVQSITLGDSIVVLHPVPTPPIELKNTGFASPTDRPISLDPSSTDAPVSLGSSPTDVPVSLDPFPSKRPVLLDHSLTGLPVSLDPSPTENLNSPHNSNIAQPGQQPIPTPGVVIGGETLRVGQTIVINGATIAVPTAESGSRILIDGKTISVAPLPTGPAILTVGGIPLTANPQSQIIVGSQTLTPGGPAITFDGSTLSLASSGTIAVVDGATKTLSPAPWITAKPVLAVDGHSVTANVIGGTTAFVLGPSQTLTDGGVVTVSGTTYSMPTSASGSVIVVNGVSSTFGPSSSPSITLANGLSVAASVKGGTTAFVIASGQTLTPGGNLTVSGSTYSMPSSASGSVVVINGRTSTFGWSSVEATTTTATPSSDTTSLRVPANSAVPSTTITSTTSRQQGAALSMRKSGFDAWFEGLFLGFAGWILLVM